MATKIGTSLKGKSVKISVTIKIQRVHSCAPQTRSPPHHAKPGIESKTAPANPEIVSGATTGATTMFASIAQILTWFCNSAMTGAVARPATIGIAIISPRGCGKKESATLVFRPTVTMAAVASTDSTNPKELANSGSNILTLITVIHRSGNAVTGRRHANPTHTPSPIQKARKTEESGPTRSKSASTPPHVLNAVSHRRRIPMSETIAPITNETCAPDTAVRCERDKPRM